jgi:hypothetical protein
MSAMRDLFWNALEQLDIPKPGLDEARWLLVIGWAADIVSGKLSESASWLRLSLGDGELGAWRTCPRLGMRRRRLGATSPTRWSATAPSTCS